MPSKNQPRILPKAVLYSKTLKKSQFGLQHRNSDKKLDEQNEEDDLPIPKKRTWNGRYSSSRHLFRINVLHKISPQEVEEGFSFKSRRNMVISLLHQFSKIMYCQKGDTFLLPFTWLKNYNAASDQPRTSSCHSLHERIWNDLG